MTQEVLKLSQEALAGLKDVEKQVRELVAENRALKEALAQTQEPVAYLCENAVGHKYFRWKKPSSTYKPIALYTSPPQRTWVGLTANELSMIGDSMKTWNSFSITDVYFAIEAKLKELNT